MIKKVSPSLMVRFSHSQAERGKMAEWLKANMGSNPILSDLILNEFKTLSLHLKSRAYLHTFLSFYFSFLI